MEDQKWGGSFSKDFFYQVMAFQQRFDDASGKRCVDDVRGG